MQLTTDRGIFSIFEQIRSSSRKTDYDEQPLHGYERVVDILSFHALDSISGKLPKGGKLESSSISGAALVDRDHSRLMCVLSNSCLCLVVSAPLYHSSILTLTPSSSKHTHTHTHTHTHIQVQGACVC